MLSIYTISNMAQLYVELPKLDEYLNTRICRIRQMRFLVLVVLLPAGPWGDNVGSPAVCSPIHHFDLEQDVLTTRGQFSVTVIFFL